MYRVILRTFFALTFVTGSASALVIVQENPAFTWPEDWDYNPLTGVVEVKTADATEPYVFWAHEDGQPDLLAPINRITRSPSLMSGAIKLKISKTEQGLTPGATEIGAITIDEAGNDDITSYLEGINITGDFLAQEAMTVDHVTGPIQVGGALRRAMEVGSTVAQPISIGDGGVGDGLAAEVTAAFQGESPAVFSDETPDDVSVAPLRTPFTQKGPEEEEGEDDWGPASHQRSFIERSAGMLRNQ